MAQPLVKLSAISTLLIKLSLFEKTQDAEKIPALNKNTVLLLAKGEINFSTAKQVTKFNAPQIIYVKEKTKHTVTALSDGVVVYTLFPLNLTGVNDFIDTDTALRAHDIFTIFDSLVVEE